jgi:glyoxylase-like metal-dependent hydrolase (beta-lactamase superfamily II)
MGMKKPFVIEIAKDTYAVNEFGMDAIYLCIGRDRALLIDTGTGTFDLKALTEQLTDKPYDVILTHGHVDHAGGIDQFEKVMIHEADIEMAAGLTLEERREYAVMLHGMDIDQAYDFAAEQVREWKRIPEFITVRDSDVIDLGERKLEIIHTPGHTPGSICILDRKNRIHFSGDACNINTLCINGSGVRELKASAERIRSYEDAFDRDYNGHFGYAGDPTCFSQPDCVRDDVIQACTMILEGRGEPDNLIMIGREAHAVSYGCARVVYTVETLCG